jgi:hypothetical protein
MRTRHLVVTSLVLVMPAIAAAQRPAADSTPHAGQWGAEASFGGGSGASLLRFLSARTALVVGAEFATGHTDSDSSEPIDSPFDGSYGSVTARVGVRRYRESRAERIRPVVGGGLRGSYATNPTDTRSWSAGAYGEVGALYFVAPHLSIGGVGEVQAMYEKTRQTSGGGFYETSRSSVVGSVIRLLVSVYF